MSRSVYERLNDILRSIEKVRVADVELAQASSINNESLVETAFDAILFNLFVIGEAVKALPNHVTDMEPDIAWVDIARLRDLIGHRYHAINPEIIHGSVRRDLGPLAAAITRMIAILDPDGQIYNK